MALALRWRHNGRDSVSNHQPHDCLLNRLFRRRSNKTSRLRVTGLCAGNSPETGEFPAQMASYDALITVSLCWLKCIGTEEILISVSYHFSQEPCNLYFSEFVFEFPWRRHQMETSSALLALCAGNSPVTDEFPSKRPVTRSFDVFFDLCRNKPMSKQSWGWWFETPSCPLWRHYNVHWTTVRLVAFNYLYRLCYCVSGKSEIRLHCFSLTVRGWGDYWIDDTLYAGEEIEKRLLYRIKKTVSLQWRHNGCAGVPNLQHRDGLLDRLFERKSKKK